MNLNAELVKKILIWCNENTPKRNERFLHASDVQIVGYSDDQIFNHLKGLVSVGYVIGGWIDASTYQVTELTWEGRILLGYMETPKLLSLVFSTIEKYGLPPLSELQELLRLSNDK